MNKKICSYLSISLLIFCGILFSIELRAQQQIVTFIGKNGYAVQDKDSAIYIRTLKRERPSDSLYTLTENYPSGSIKRTGKVTRPDGRLLFEGEVNTFLEDGTLLSKETYHKNKRTGEANYYYNNGQLKKSIRYAISTDKEDAANATREHLLTYCDSLGKVMVKNGKGHAVHAENDRDSEEGQYKNGLKQGLWKGTFLKGKYQFTEKYKDGKLLSGETKDSLGAKITTYDQLREEPQFQGGISKFHEYIAKNYKYPKEAIKEQVKGTVVIGFVIDTTGTPVEVKAIQDLGYNTAPQGIQLIANSPKWEPGKWRGIPVRVSYSIPIRLNMKKK